LVVLNQEDHRKFPDCRQIDGLVEITDVGRAFSQDAEYGVMLSLIADPQSYTCGDRQVTSHDGMPAPVIVLGAGKVHGTALAPTDASGLAQELCHHCLWIQSAGNGPPMIAIGCEQMVCRKQRFAGADGDRFLSDVKMQEPADLSLGVQLSGFLFESPDEDHLPIELEKLVFGQFLRHLYLLA
jgi:hypothetical protein